jgi:hypothetical protein
VFIENFDVEADTFLRCKGVHIAANRIDLAGNRFRGASFRSFEYHVLDEMGDAIPFGILVARTRLEPDADRDGADVGHLLSDNSEAVRKYLTANAASFFPKYDGWG